MTDSPSDKRFEEERGLLLSQLMFGWLLDAVHGNNPPVFTLTPAEYLRRSEALATPQEQAKEGGK
jgi:hypothetical protein